MVLAVETRSSPWDHQSLRFRLTQHTKGSELLTQSRGCCCGISLLPLGPLHGEPHTSSRVPAESGHGNLVLGLMQGCSEEPQSWERCSSLFGMQHLQVWGSLTLTILSLLSYTFLIPNPCLPVNKPWRPASGCVSFKSVLVQLRAWVNAPVPSYCCCCCYCVCLCWFALDSPPR